MDQKHLVINHKGSVILKDIVITGEVESNKDVYLDGFIDGNINCKGQVIIDKSGVVGGDVECDRLFLNGKIVGNVSVNNKAVLGANAKIQGGLITSCLEITSGAKIIQGLEFKNALK